MPVKIQPTNIIKLGLGINSGGRISKFATKTCARYMDDFVPFREGNLAKYTIVGNEIHYDQPYAQYQYYGVSKNGNDLNYSKEKHTYAGPYWDSRMMSARGSQVLKEIQNEMER